MRPLFQRLFILDLVVAFFAWNNPYLALAVELNELTFITESSASFNYVRNGKLQGPAVELLLAASAHVNSPVKRENIQVLPWARGLRNTQQGVNTVLFSTIRTPEREKSFQWVGPIATEHDVLIALKTREISLNKPEDMKLYITGAVRDDVGEQILHDEQVPPHKIVLLSHSTNLGMMLLAGRIDLWIFGESGWRETLISTGIDPDSFEIVYRFPPKRYYFALSTDIESQLVEKFQQAIDSVLESNEVVF